MLVFFYDKNLNPLEREKLNMPLRFISFAYIDAALYKMYSKTSHIKKWDTYYAASLNIKGKKRTKVFGAIYLLEYEYVNIKPLDSFYACSLGVLGKNNLHDLYHRVELTAYTINNVTPEQIQVERYLARGEAKVNVYVANPEHPKFINRINNNQYKVFDRMVTQHYEEQREAILREETGEDTNK